MTKLSARLLHCQKVHSKDSKVTPRSARLVKGQQGHFNVSKDSKVSPMSERPVQGQQNKSKVSQGQCKVTQVNPRPAMVSKSEQKLQFQYVTLHDKGVILVS